MQAIYIVDDDDSVRSSLYELVRSFSNTIVRSFRSGDEFLDAIDELDSGLVLLDLNMPGTPGMEVLAQSKDNPKLSFVILTGQGDIQKAVKAIQEGALNFIEKPYHSDEILTVIETGLADLEENLASQKRAERAQAKIDRLSPRERDVLTGLVNGQSNRSIAEDFDLSPRTIEVYRANVMEKLEARHLSDVITTAFRAGAMPD